MNRKHFAYHDFSILSASVVCFVLLQIIGGGASGSLAAPDTVHLHGQIRDTDGHPRQGLVVISTFLGPDITQSLSTVDGDYAFDLPPQDHYVVTVFPTQRVSLGAVEVPVGFLDQWQRINRTTETDLTLDLTVKPGGALLLDAYDPLGNRLFIDTLPNQVFFITYPLGNPPVTDPLQGENHQRSLLWGWETVAGTLRNPAVVMLPSAPSQGPGAFTIWGLWTVPEAGTIMLDMDNGGVGYSVAEGEAKTINVAYEIARTQYRKAQEKYTQRTSAGYNFSPEVALWLAQAQAALNTAQEKLVNGDGQAAALNAYQALTPTIRAKEEIALEVAQQDIQNRRLPVTIHLVGVDQKPVSDVQVDYQQINHDFVLGANWPGDEVPLGDTPATRHYVGNTNLYTEMAKQIGLEYLNNPPGPMWGLVQREWPSVPYRFDDDVILYKMANLGFRSTGQTIWFAKSPSDYPVYLNGLGYPQVKTAGLDFLNTTVSHFAGKIQWWNLVNEPNTANALAFTPSQMLDFAKAALVTGKAADPEGVMFLNLSAPGLGQFGKAPGDPSTANFSTYTYLQEMLAAGVRPDVVGFQFYNGAYLPAIDLGTASDLLDVYGQDFDLPFYVEELEYPTHEEYPGLANISNIWGWHQGHTDQAQADWAVGMFTLAYSKPYILGANWSMSYDLPADLIESGREGDGYLHRDGLTLRPMAYALSDLFHSWTISGAAQTNSGGQIGFTGFAGKYQVTLTGTNGAVQQETIHVKEGQTNAFTILFDPAQALEKNRRDALASLGKAQQTIAWANNLNKTSGVAEARSLYSQAQTAYNAGQFWDAATLAAEAWDALAIKVDGAAEDWAGVSPLYSQTDAQGQANSTQLRHFYATLDGQSLVMQFEFDTSSPRRNFLFELDAGADGVLDYSVTASPQSSNTLFYSDVYAGHPDLIFTHLIPSIDVIYGSTVEVRIPLADLGNPSCVGVLYYRENLEDGSISGVIPSLGIVTAPPWHISLPLVMKK